MAYAQIIRNDGSIADIVSFPLKSFDPKKLCEIADTSSNGEWDYINIQKVNLKPFDYIITRDENGEIFIKRVNENAKLPPDALDKIVNEWMKM